MTRECLHAEPLWGGRLLNHRAESIIAAKYSSSVSGAFASSTYPYNKTGRLTEIYTERYILSFRAILRAIRPSYWYNEILFLLTFWLASYKIRLFFYIIGSENKSSILYKKLTSYFKIFEKFKNTHFIWLISLTLQVLIFISFMIVIIFKNFLSKENIKKH